MVIIENNYSSRYSARRVEIMVTAETLGKIYSWVNFDCC